LTADMGRLLGCGAHLKSLRRTACGHLRIDAAITLPELERMTAEQKPALLPLSSALGHLRAITWEGPSLARLRLGQQGILSQIGNPANGEQLLRICGPRGELVALAEWSDNIAGGRWRLSRVFHE
jgi:tRNA U55 pseudouridine synthase TruB